MKRLIWKEWREKRLWLLVFFAFVAGTTMISHEGLSFGGSFLTTSPWVYVLLIPALLMGLSTFSRETGYECQDFLYSRAIGWKKVLGAKLLVDAAIMLLAIVAGAIVFWLFLPPSYMMFHGVGSKIASGAIIAFVVALMGYLPGFGASVVLPGMLGGGLVLCLVGITMGAEAVLVMGSGTARENSVWPALILAWVIAVIATSILMSKHGLGLSVKERARKYAICVAVISTAMLLWTVPAANHYVNIIPTYTTISTDISPDGRIVLEIRRTAKDGIWELSLCRRSDGKTVQVGNVISMSFDPSNTYGWSAPDTLVLFRGVWLGCSSDIVKMRMDESGHLIKHETSVMPMAGMLRTLLSPSGRYAFLREYRGETVHRARGTRDFCRICILDVAKMKPIFVDDFSNNTISGSRWESDNALTIMMVVKNEEHRSIRKVVTLHITSDNKVNLETTQ